MIDWATEGLVNAENILGLKNGHGQGQKEAQLAEIRRIAS